MIKKLLIVFFILFATCDSVNDNSEPQKNVPVETEWSETTTIETK